MSRREPETDREFVALVDATLADVPLSSEEAEDARRDFGLDTTRLTARIRTRLEEVRRAEQQAVFARAAEDLRVAQRKMTAKIAPRQLSREDAKRRLHALEAMPNARAAMEGYKLDKMSDDDLNRVVAEMEALIPDDGSS